MASPIDPDDDDDGDGDEREARQAKAKEAAPLEPSNFSFLCRPAGQKGRRLAAETQSASTARVLTID